MLLNSIQVNCVTQLKRIVVDVAAFHVTSWSEMWMKSKIKEMQQSRVKDGQEKLCRTRVK